jgi:hypothetical protein
MRPRREKIVKANKHSLGGSCRVRKADQALGEENRKQNSEFRIRKRETQSGGVVKRSDFGSGLKCFELLNSVSCFLFSQHPKQDEYRGQVENTFYDYLRKIW